MKIGTLDVLSCGHGHDPKIVFDPNDAAAMERGKRMIKDMLRRGYALLIEVDGKHRRVHDFDENTFEYIIGDFDSLHAAEVDSQTPPPPEPQEQKDEPPRKGKGNGRRTRRVSAAGSTGVAVGRTAGG